MRVFPFVVVLTISFRSFAFPPLTLIRLGQSEIDHDFPSTLPRISFNKGSRATTWSTNTRTYIQESAGIEQKVRCMNGPSDFLARGLDGYLVEAAALALPRSGTTPSCCIRARASQLTQPSSILPFAKRAMLTPVMLTCFPVGGIPLRSPLWVPLQDHRATTVSPSAMMSSIVNRMSGKAVR